MKIDEDKWLKILGISLLVIGSIGALYQLIVPGLVMYFFFKEKKQ